MVYRRAVNKARHTEAKASEAEAKASEAEAKASEAEVENVLWYSLYHKQVSYV